MAQTARISPFQNHPHPCGAEWLIPGLSVKPHFVICGAMKSGTSTLHHILASHPGVFIPQIEPQFFCCDDFDGLCECSAYQGNDRVSPPNYHGWDRLWQWYSKLFKPGVEAGKVLGEDCAGYLYSRMALKRLAQLQPPPKLIVALRQPAERAYSQYWHMAKTGRSLYTFENTLNFDPEGVLYRSRYKQHLAVLFDVFPREQVHVIIFEEFLRRPCSVMEKLCRFLDIDFGRLPENWKDTHANPAKLPKFLALDRFMNRFLFHQRTRKYLRQFNMLDVPRENTFGRKLGRLVNNVHRRFNPIVEKRPPKLSAQIKHALDQHFRCEFEGLADLLDKDIHELWF